MRRLRIALLAVMMATCAWADEGKDVRKDEVGRLEEAGTVLTEVMSAPDNGIPAEILQRAKCVAVVPSLLKGGLGIGGAYGKGVATCRTDKAQTGKEWSAPAFFSIEGGSFGLQIGGQAVDLVMVIMNERGMRALLSSKFKLGADVSVAAGPVGRHLEGMTDWKLRAQVLTYSRARGLFAGITLNGAAIHQDRNATRDFYGYAPRFKTILTGGVAPAEGSEPFLTAVQHYSTVLAAEKAE
jgi:lipid-binding SYLF domain-containing protein